MIRNYRMACKYYTQYSCTQIERNCNIFSSICPFQIQFLYQGNRHKRNDCTIIQDGYKKNSKAARQWQTCQQRVGLSKRVR